MSNMYGRYHRDHQNSGGWSKSARKRVEFEQDLKDAQYPTNQHIHGQICGQYGNGCEDISCFNYFWSMNDDWDTYSFSSAFDTYSGFYTTES